MNWKNITLEQGFVKQELNFNGANAVNYIPLEQVDSFGVVSSENKRWLYAGIFFLFCSLVMLISKEGLGTMLLGLVGAALIGIYFFTKQTWFNITSSQTKFSVQVRTTPEELKAVNDFVLLIKQRIHISDKNENQRVA
jgi:hypothetical protein